MASVSRLWRVVLHLGTKKEENNVSLCVVLCFSGICVFILGVPGKFTHVIGCDLLRFHVSECHAQDVLMCIEAESYVLVMGMLLFPGMWFRVRYRKSAIVKLVAPPKE